MIKIYPQYVRKLFLFFYCSQKQPKSWMSRFYDWDLNFKKSRRNDFRVKMSSRKIFCPNSSAKEKYITPRSTSFFKNVRCDNKPNRHLLTFNYFREVFLKHNARSTLNDWSCCCEEYQESQLKDFPKSYSPKNTFGKLLRCRGRILSTLPF